MSEENLESKEKLDKIAINFVDSLFNDYNNILTEEEQKTESSHPENYDQKLKKEEKPKLSENKTPNTKPSNKQNKSTSQKKTLTKITKKNNINNNSNKKNLFSDKYPKSNYLTKSVRQIEKNKKENKDDNSTTNTISSKNEIYRAKQDSMKEKKLYEERVKILRNHINRLKKQEIELNKKAEQAKEKEKDKIRLKKEKYDKKQFLLSAEIDKRKALEEKKKIISQQRVENDINLKESQKKKKMKK